MTDGSVVFENADYSCRAASLFVSGSGWKKFRKDGLVLDPWSSEMRPSQARCTPFLRCLCSRYIGPQVENTVKQLLYMAGNKDIRGSYPWGTQRLQGLHVSDPYTCEVLLFGHPIVSPWYITVYLYYIMVYYGIL